MISGIYKIENKINGHLYIGRAKDIKGRWGDHRYHGKILDIKYPLYSAINKYGIENFSFEIIEKMSLENYLKFGGEREKYWIKYYDAYENKDNYNITEGGESGTLGWVPSNEWREHQSKIKKEYYKTEAGKIKLNNKVKL